jgi:hypothetical protein
LPGREAAVGVLLYGLNMPARKIPTPQDAATARQLLLDGLARDDGIDDIITGLAHLHPRHDTFPGEVFLHLCSPPPCISVPPLTGRACRCRTHPRS